MLLTDTRFLQTSKNSKNINTVSYEGKTILLPSTQYNWQTWNCFHLANHIRKEFGLSELPDLEHIWKRDYKHELSAPDTMVKNLIWKHCHRKLEPRDFNLGILNFGNADNLATVLDGKIIFIGRQQACIMPLHRVNCYLDSVWQYIPNV